ncbi:unnamed protein product, partial [Vitis vinifera]
MASSISETLTLTLPAGSPQDSNLDDHICSEQQEHQECQSSSADWPSRCLTGESRIERAWAHWKKLGQPKLIVAPMVDNSELPFRMLCRKYGAQAAYTPMLHSRIFSENEKYRSQEFTTCKEDRPLFVQFCANDPDTLLEAAQRVEPYCDYVDINLGCPQRIARRGNYGAFLMDNLPLVKSLVEKLALNLHVPVSCKIRVFPNLQDTINYARMLEDAGCSLLARCLEETDQANLLVEYLKLCEKYPVPWRMIRSHVHKLLGEWFRIQPQVRDDLNSQSKLTFEFLYNMVDQLRELGVRIPLYTKDTPAGRTSNGIAT